MCGYIFSTAVSVPENHHDVSEIGIKLNLVRRAGKSSAVAGHPDPVKVSRLESTVEQNRGIIRKQDLRPTGQTVQPLDNERGTGWVQTPEL